MPERENPNSVDDILFVGVGIMGAPMAQNLAAAGFSVSVWNRTMEKARAIEGKGVRIVEDLSGLGLARRSVILMVSTGAVADEVLFGSETAPGLSEALAPGSDVIVMSSIPVDVAERQAQRLWRARIDYIDAPVSGGERGAIDGTLTIMAGGDSAVIERLRPLFAPMGRVTHVGPVGAGQLAKLANQTIVGVTIGAVAEALLLAEAGGADPRAVREALLGGFADSTVLRQHGARMVDESFEPGAHCHVQLKDVTTAQALAEHYGVDAPLLRRTRDLYAELCETPLRMLDHSALYLHLRDRGKSV